MHSDSNKIKTLVGYGIKVAMFFALVVVIFSPLSKNIFPLHTASAAAGSYTSCYSAEGTYIDYERSGTVCPNSSRGATAYTVNIPDSTTIFQETIPNIATDPRAKKYTGPAGQDANAPSSCNFDTLDICISNVVYVFTVGLMSTFAYIAGYFFDFAVHLSLQGPIYALDFISLGWTWARDIANMAFILIIMYLAFTIMLKAEMANTFRTLAGVVVVALLVNFSFFITRVVVDAGNIVAVQLYNAIPGAVIDIPVPAAAANLAKSTASLTSNTGTSASDSSINNVSDTKDLTASIMGAIKIQNILGTQSFKAFSQSADFLTKLITLSLIYIAVGIMFALLAGSFLFAGIKFVMRVVGLWFVIISAPLAFVAAALEKGGESKTKLFARWQGKLLQYAFYPAIYLFMFLILSHFMASLATGCTSSIASVAKDSGGAGCLIGNIFDSVNAAAVSQNNFIVTISTAIANVFIRLGLVVSLMYIALSVSDLIVTEGSDKARGFQQKIVGALSGGAGRLGGFGYQQTVGRGASALDRNLKTTGFGNSWLGYRIRQGAQQVAGGSVGGARSYQDFEKARKVELKERGAYVPTSSPVGKDAAKSPYEAAQRESAARASAANAARRAQTPTPASAQSKAATPAPTNTASNQPVAGAAAAAMMPIPEVSEANLEKITAALEANSAALEEHGSHLAEIARNTKVMSERISSVGEETPTEDRASKNLAAQTSQSVDAVLKAMKAGALNAQPIVIKNEMPPSPDYNQKVEVTLNTPEAKEQKAPTSNKLPVLQFENVNATINNLNVANDNKPPTEDAA